MPSTLVHLALAGLLAAALLGDEFDGRSLVVVLAVTAAIDLDTVVGIFVRGAHRAAFHTLLLPAGLALGLALDDRLDVEFRLPLPSKSGVRDEGFEVETPLVHGRWGRRGVRVAWVSVAALLFAGIGPDLFTNGVAVLWPVDNGFYEVTGELLFSDQRGVVQTFVELGQEPVGTTENKHYRTGVDPAPIGESDAEAERIFPVAASGMQLLLLLVGTVTVGARLWEERS